MSDPDRFFNFSTPGAHEWWYFDAISDDGRDAIVLVWYAALPFDPEYGVAALRHQKDPSRFPAPRPLNHCAVGLNWYRDGRTMAYALNGFREGDFSHEAEPFGVTIAGNTLVRDADGYHLSLDTPAVDGRSRIVARLRFAPVAGTQPFESDFGSASSNHLWIVAAPDCQVEGDVAIGQTRLNFTGRGYHDHNADAQEISRVWRRWHWGRVHVGRDTHVYYHTEPQDWMASNLWLVFRDGRCVDRRSYPVFHEEASRRNLFWMRSPRTLVLENGEDRLEIREARAVDDGPFYRRSLSEFRATGPAGEVGAFGITEVLDTRNLNRPIFNWMIPFRLKRPSRL